jgi:hypothetical protein
MRYKRATIVIVVLAAMSMALAAEDAKTAFNWAFAKRAADGSAVSIDFNERVGIVKGDLFKIYISPLSCAFVYLFLHDEGGDLQLLFPDDFSLFAKASYLNSRYFIPEGDHWFALDDSPGTERFYLIASAERLNALESLVSSYASASPDKKGAARQAVLDEIARVRRQYNQLTVTAEKPLTVAGGIRGINANVEKLATRIEADGFYYKVFRLEH